MNPILRNVLSVIAGIILGSVVNMGLVMLGPSVIPPPEGVDVTDMDSLKASMHLFETRHFIFPFLAHALGTLAGAYVVASISISNKRRLAFLIGCFFLIGGITNAFLLPSPTWFIGLDLVVAYLPMAWLGGRLVKIG